MGKDGSAGKARHTPLAQLITQAVDSGEFFYSFEYSPSRDPRLEDLFARVARMGALRPLFVDVTWGFGDVGAKSIEAARHIQKKLGIPVLMHLILTDMSIAEIDKALDAARLAGVRAILVLRGYTQAGYDRWQPCEGGLMHADELCAHIRRVYGSHFSLGVAGFPSTHPESRLQPGVAPSADERDEDVRWLKAKVDAGADFVICQFTFDLDEWSAFLRRCRAAGIRVPILPGVQPLTEYASARLLASAWGVPLPDAVSTELRKLSDTDDVEGAFECGLRFISQLCDAILRHAIANSEGCGLHFFVYDGEREVRALLDVLQTEHGWTRGQRPSICLRSR